MNFFRGMNRTNNMEVLCTAKNLYEIRYETTSSSPSFLSGMKSCPIWMDVSPALPDNAFLELLHDNVKHLKLMDNRARSDPARSYQALKDIINDIRRERDESQSAREASHSRFWHGMPRQLCQDRRKPQPAKW